MKNPKLKSDIEHSQLGQKDMSNSLICEMLVSNISPNYNKANKTIWNSLMCDKGEGSVVNHFEIK